MSYKEEDIVHETANHFVLKVKKGYVVYRNGITHAEPMAIFGSVKNALGRAISECNEREANYKSPFRC